MSLAGCRKDKCIHGDGNLIIEERLVSVFTGLKNYLDCEVYIYRDTISKVMVDCDQNIQQYISVSVDRSKNLILDKNTKQCIITDDPIQIEVHTPGVSYIDLLSNGYVWADSLPADNLTVILNSSGEINLLNLNSSYIKAVVDGSGEIELTGNNTTSDLYMDGSGQIRANRLVQNESYITVEGSGEVMVQVLDYLDILIPGSGTVLYYYVPPNSTLTKLTC
jgi:hypothetical protein